MASRGAFRLARFAGARARRRTSAHEIRVVLRDPRRPAVVGRQRARRLQEHVGAGDRRREGGLPRVLDGRAPLPGGVLALLESRGVVRRDRESHEPDAFGLRSALDAAAVQPSGAHGRVGRRPRLAQRRPRRLRYGPVGDADRARGLRRRPEGHTGDVARGDRARRRLLDQRPVLLRGQALVAARPARAAQAAAAAPPADLGRDHERRRTRPGRRARPRVVFVRGRCLTRGREEEDRHLPRRSNAVHGADRQVREQPGRDVHDGHLRAERGRGGARSPASRSSGTRRSARGRSRRSRNGWRSASRRSATTTTPPT